MKDLVEGIIISKLPDPGKYPAKVVEAMNYAMSAGGKRIRPTLMMLTFNAVRNNQSSKDRASDLAREDILKSFMAAIEMIHTHSLIHDDLPALDNDTLRRGRATVHVKFDESTAILAGDALLNYAYERVASDFDGSLLKYRTEHLMNVIGNREKSFLDQLELTGSFDDMMRKLSQRAIEMDEDDMLTLAGEELDFRSAYQTAFAILSSKTGIDGMLGGQAFDVEKSGADVNDEERDYIYKNKTAALIQAPLMIGGTLAGSDKKTVAQLEKAGEALGLAFQVQDDILDIVGDKDKLGKEVHQDQRNEKNTYAAIFGLEKSREFVKTKSEEAIDIIENVIPSNESRDKLIELINLLIDRDN